MIGRVAARSLRSHVTTATVPTITLNPFIRTYAKHNRPKKPGDYKPHQVPSSISRTGPGLEHSRGPVSAATSGSSAGSTSQRIDRLEKSNVSKSQDESTFIRATESPQPSPPADSSKAQEELEKSALFDVEIPSKSSPNMANPLEEKDADQPSPLPDLTRGIPSTLDSELAVAASGTRASPTSLNITENPSEAPPGGREAEGLPNSAYISSLERRRNRLANYMFVTVFGLSIVGSIYLGRNWETEEEETKHPDAPSGWGFGLFYHRASARLRDMLDYYNEPAFPKLLPNTDPLWERPYTLVLSLEDLLVHSEWTREHGWRMAKRPGVDYFLRYLSQYYELVIFTSVPSMIGDPIIRKLDPFRIVLWPLFREATRFKGGEYIKVSGLHG